MNATDLTIEIIRTHSLRAILLAPRLKRPPTGKFPVTTDVSEILEHLDQGGNLGILAGNIQILDFDRIDLANEMFVKIGFLPPTVRTGSGKIHCYVRSSAQLPARLHWDGEKVGEIQRGENQYVVCPPSIHPDGGEYRWIGDDVTSAIATLPEAWLNFLVNEMTPDLPEWLQKYATEGKPEEEKWDGPEASVLLQRAGAMPRAKRRKFGIKFRCPACAQEGHDKSFDNAIVFNDGRWACAYAPGDAEHKRAIGKALGFVSPIAEHAKEFFADEDVKLEAPDL